MEKKRRSKRQCQFLSQKAFLLVMQMLRFLNILELLVATYINKSILLKKRTVIFKNNFLVFQARLFIGRDLVVEGSNTYVSFINK